jgi:hypothetical protein
VRFARYKRCLLRFSRSSFVPIVVSAAAAIENFIFPVEGQQQQQHPLLPCSAEVGQIFLGKGIKRYAGDIPQR